MGSSHLTLQQSSCVIFSLSKVQESRMKMTAMFLIPIVLGLSAAAPAPSPAAQFGFGAPTNSFNPSQTCFGGNCQQNNQNQNFNFGGGSPFRGFGGFGNRG